MPDGADREDRLERLIGRAKLVIAFERFWPPFVLALVIVGLFVACAWLGLWVALPRQAHILGLAAFAVGLAGAGVLAVRAGVPSRADALARLDRDSGHRHRPVSSSQDRLANPDADPATRALWDLHRRRLAEAAGRVEVRKPSPRLVERDRFALRAAAVLALVASGFVAGVDKQGRLAAAFDVRSAGASAAGFRLDAWIDPPPYTGRAPLLLPAPGSSGSGGTPQKIAAPVNSIVVIRSAGEGKVDVDAAGGLKPAAPAVPSPGSSVPHAADPAGGEHRLVLSGDGQLKVQRDGAPYSAFDLHAIPDLPPTIAVTKPPAGNLRGSLSVSYKIDDDYGVVGAEAAFASPILHGKKVEGRSLVSPPTMALTLPNGGRGLGTGETTADLSEHPWAGAAVTMILSAKDEGGNVGHSAPVTTTLPARIFHQPLARALVEQRRDLVLDPDHRSNVSTSLDALTIAPDLFGVTSSVFLGLDAAKTRLRDAKGDADLLEVADLLWSMALSIEEGDLSPTERDLRALQKELRDAIARGAPPDEIKKLAEALKQQLEKFLAEMAQKSQESQDRGPSDRNGKMVTPRDLQSLLDRMEKSAENGDMAEAQQLLDQLQNILENLRSAQRGDAGNQGSQEMNQSMGALDRMMRDQQGLRDRTFQRGNQRRQAKRKSGQDGQDQADGESGDEPPAGDDSQSQADDGQGEQDLQGQQQALSEQLRQLQKQMRELGLNGEPGLDEAQQAMKDAEQALGKGGAGNDRAVEAQGRALQGLQKGARGLQGQMAQGEDGHQGESGMGRADGTGQRDGTDPLGRQRGSRDRGTDAQGGFNPGEGLAERAQKVLEELRRRLGDRMRPQEEQDYLERLLKRY